MTSHQIMYLVFGLVIALALVFDLGLLSKKNKTVSIKTALLQTLFWVLLAMGFFVFILLEEGHKPALEYLSAYLMEWSLSIDNIFVFILIFTSFKIKEQYYSRVLLIGILMAIIFRVIFISVGVTLVEKFEWIMYLFGVFLLYTGIKMFIADEEKNFNPEENKVYKFLKRIFPIVSHDGDGKFVVKEDGKKQYTILFVVVILLATIDLAFALDSIPAVMGISRERIIIYTSNIFAVLGLRSLFFLLKGAVNKFDYLQQGISVVLVFIGVKMLAQHFITGWFKNNQTLLSLGVIILCIGSSILYSLYIDKKRR